MKSKEKRKSRESVYERMNERSKQRQRENHYKDAEEQEKL